MNTSWIYTVADVLQMPLTPQVGSNQLKGSVEIAVHDASIKFRMEVMATHDNDNELGLMVKVDSKLYIYLLYSHNTRTVALYFVNGGKLSTVPQKEFFAINCTGKQVLDKMKDAIVKSYYRNKDKAKWINH